MADGNVKIHDIEEQKEVLEDSAGPSVCGFCMKNSSKYTCPRCNARYCSVQCYRGEKHMSCSELFYKECFMTALKNERGNDDDKKKVMDMLKRLEEENSPVEEEEVESLEERLADVNLDGDPELTWNQLTDKEKREFEEIVRNGVIGDLVEVWSAWWEPRDKRAKIEELQDKPKGDVAEKNTIPNPVKKIPTLASLTGGKPSSACIKFNMIDILYSYTYILRLYNGSHSNMMAETAQGFLKVSSVLSHNEVFDSTEAVFHSCITNIQQNEDIRNSAEFTHNVIKDVIAISKGERAGSQHSGFVISALSDLYRILSCGRDELKTSQENGSINKQETQKSLMLAKKKVHFMLAWVQENYTELASLVLALETEYAKLALEYEHHQQEKSKLEEAWGGVKPQKKRTLIEELS